METPKIHNDDYIMSENCTCAINTEQIRAPMSVLNRRKSTKALARQQLAQYINQENVDETDLLLPPEYTLDNIEQQLGSAKRSFWQPREFSSCRRFCLHFT